jgi:alpha-glucuronidase
MVNNVMNMKYQFQVTVLALYLFAGTFAAFARQQCPLTPVPKVYKQLDGNIEIKTPDTAIVIGSKADQVDQYAAQRLQVLIEKRFGATLTIINEDQAAKAGHAIVLGQIETNKIVADLCARNKIELGEKSPGFDGFIIETIKDNGRDIILIGGSNARGVTYGMSAFFEMLD